ncbi:glycosyltransferase family 4 protein [Paenibacillus eucommiae]|uniref:Glycosyltransferase involved in cell wall biosynthesis n=1 Tax=Paenibacillus eucommiae TaxID=1355755 RepID=A0ABS4J2A5_9BACL|nr:glycosyltransferase family 4 protein [Paenibacillus eucommiae]MBP1993967.1 glycosyltransferase involved in cell wall biosynthesis [Paenibacillus eucommiae]
MKHILFIQPYASQVGGVDTVLLQLIQGLDGTRYCSFVMLSSPSVYAEKYEALGAKVIYGPLAVFGKPTDFTYYPRNFLMLLKSVSFLLKLVRELHIDLIHSHKMEVIGANLVGKWLSIPTVQTVHELPRRPLIAYKFVALLDHLLNDKVIVLCERSKAMFRWFNKESGKLEKIYNGISVKHLNQANQGLSGIQMPPMPQGIQPSPPDDLRQQLGLSPQARILITVARLSPMKGLEYLIEAAARIRPIKPDLKFIIVGDVAFEQEKPYKEKLLKKITALELQDTVFMLGLRRDVPELLQQADILILPSVYDIFPTVILEAMSMGLPVIATDVGGVPEMVRPDTGMLIPPKDAEALQKQILAMCSLDYKTMGNNARRLFAEEFTQEQYVNQTVAIYEELWANQKEALAEHA